MKGRITRGGDVAGRLEDLDAGLADEAHELEGVAKGLVGRAQAAHDLDQRHHRHRRQEMQSEDAVGPLRAGRDLAHGERGGVGGQDVFRRADEVELLEDRGLQLQVVGHRLHHELGRLQGPEGVHGADAGQDRALLRFRAAPLRDVVVEGMDDLGHGLLRRLRRALADQHVQARRPRRRRRFPGPSCPAPTIPTARTITGLR
jgi:hypothetical protein